MNISVKKDEFWYIMDHLNHDIETCEFKTKYHFDHCDTCIISRSCLWLVFQEKLARKLYKDAED